MNLSNAFFLMLAAATSASTSATDSSGPMNRLRGVKLTAKKESAAVVSSSVSHGLDADVHKEDLAFLEQHTMTIPASSRNPKFTVDANELVSLRLDNGDVWTSGSGSSWTERKRGRNGVTYNWEETSSDNNSVKLFDSERGYYARIGLRAGEVALCDGPDSGCSPFGTIKDVTVRDSDSEEALLQLEAMEPSAEDLAFLQRKRSSTSTSADNARRRKRSSASTSISTSTSSSTSADNARRRKSRQSNKKGAMMVPASSREPKFTVNTNDLLSLRLNNGDAWTSGSGSSWTERKRGRNGATYNWEETSSDRNSVKLVDNERGYYARIGLRAGEVSLCDGPDSGCSPFGTIKDVAVRDSDSEEALLQLE